MNIMYSASSYCFSMQNIDKAVIEAALKKRGYILSGKRWEVRRNGRVFDTVAIKGETIEDWWPEMIRVSDLEPTR